MCLGGFLGDTARGAFGVSGLLTKLLRLTHQLLRVRLKLAGLAAQGLGVSDGLLDFFKELLSFRLKLAGAGFKLIGLSAHRRGLTCELARLHGERLR